MSHPPPTSFRNPRTTTAWNNLSAAALHIKDITLRDVFAREPMRGHTYCAEGAGVALDYSKQRVTLEVLDDLMRLAVECDLDAHRTALFSGLKVNTTEHRAALHTALRAPIGSTIAIDGTDVVGDVQTARARMARIADAIRSDKWRGTTGRPIRNVVNIGIGGSDLGPAMADRALDSYVDQRLTRRFVANVDPGAMTRALRGLDPAETLIIVSSKTFTTHETMMNAAIARAWLVDGLGGTDTLARHMLAVSTNLPATSAFGIPDDNVIGFWDWVGGRYSMDSAIGLITMIAIGPTHFDELLAGFHAMDTHFYTAPFIENLPVLMGMIGIWNRNFLGAPTVCVAPYSDALRRFPAYLQQLTMESNGKHVRQDGTAVDYDTGSIYWGEPGTSAQHSFFQMLHQGTSIIPVDFIGVLTTPHPHQEMQTTLLANLIAQSRALAFGHTATELSHEGAPPDLVAHKQMDGNRPSSTLTIDALTPHALGALIALYEHTVFTQSVIWGINAFDQWGVELGKHLADDIEGAILGSQKPDQSYDTSTAALIARVRDVTVSPPAR